jgi:hypothetical protein
MSDVFGGDARTCAWLILDYDLLTENRPTAFGENASGHISRRSGRKPDNDVDRARRISVIRQCWDRRKRHCGGAGRQV